MKITKTELKEMIREALRGELKSSKKMQEAWTPDDVEYKVTYRLVDWDSTEPNEEAFLYAEDALKAIDFLIENMLDDENNDDIPLSDRIQESDIIIIAVEPV